MKKQIVHGMTTKKVVALGVVKSLKLWGLMAASSRWDGQGAVGVHVDTGGCQGEIDVRRTEMLGSFKVEFCRTRMELVGVTRQLSVSATVRCRISVKLEHFLSSGKIVMALIIKRLDRTPKKLMTTTRMETARSILVIVRISEEFLLILRNRTGESSKEKLDKFISSGHLKGHRL